VSVTKVYQPLTAGEPSNFRRRYNSRNPQRHSQLLLERSPETFAHVPPHYRISESSQVALDQLESDLR
jgi:hypothetical protein